MEHNSLSLIERALLANQFKILSFLDTPDAEGHLINAEIFERGYTGLYPEALKYVHTDEISNETCTETHDILTMFRYINNAKSKLQLAELSKLNLEAIKFDGFDANYDDHYQFLVFMIEKQDKYTEYDPNGVNSHSMTSILRYRKMLPVYKNLLEKKIYDFGTKELQQLIDAVNNS